jgi:transketolase C-terminal domain/subunit
VFTADLGETGPRAAIVTYGRISKNALDAAQTLGETMRVRVIRLLRIHPLPTEAVREALDGIENCTVAEEAMRRGGIGEALAAALPEIRVRIAAPTDFIRHGDTASLTKAAGLDAAAIARAVRAADGEK